MNPFRSLFSMLNGWLSRSLLGSEPKALPEVSAMVLPDKDLTDQTQTDNCGPWNLTKYYCNHCDATSSYDEWLEGFCKKCGSLQCVRASARSWRKVVSKGEWKFQLRYDNGINKVVDKVP